MIYLTGDTHGTHGIGKLISTTMTEQDYLIILGDFGALWSGGIRDEELLKWYADQPYTTLWLDGNHENFDLIKSYPVTEMFGGKVQKISDKVIHLMRGEAYEINGKSFFVMGGATSIDKLYRTEGLSWWPDELPSDEEFKYAEDTLAAHEYTFDYILSHCCGKRTQDMLLHKNHALRYGSLTDPLVAWFDDLEDKLSYKHWYFGHYHFDTVIDDKHTCLYHQILDITKKSL